MPSHLKSKVPRLSKRNGGSSVGGKREANHGAYSPPQTAENFWVSFGIGIFLTVTALSWATRRWK